SIANRNNVSIDLIKDINKLANNNLRIGQVLNIPKSSTGTRAANNLAQATHSNSSRTVYKVRAGDNLSKIAAQQKVSVNELKRWNNLSSNALKIGQNLILISDNSSQNANSSNATVYKVRPGDSL